MKLKTIMIIFCILLLIIPNCTLAATTSSVYDMTVSSGQAIINVIWKVMQVIIQKITSMFANIDLSKVQIGKTTETTITLSSSSLSIKTNESKTITATVTPSDGEVKWSSGNTKVATVKNGTVTGVGTGTTTITATCNEKSATCNVTVSQAAASSSSNTYKYNNTEYKIMTKKDNLTTVLNTISSKNFKQSNGGNCFVYAAVQSLMLNGKITNPSYKEAYSSSSSSYSTTLSASNTEKFYAMVKEYVDNGKSLVIKVKNSYSSTGYHWVSVVGYKGKCTSFSDLLLLGSYSGKLISGSSAGETDKGLASYTALYFNKTIK